MHSLLVTAFAASAGTQGISGGQSPAAKGAVIDQANADILDSYVNGGSAAYEWQQGVTAGLGGQLTRLALFGANVDLFGDAAASTISITLGAPWQSGLPAWSVTTVLHPGGWNTFDLTKAKIFVAAGDQYSIGIHGQSTSTFPPAFGISYEDQYSGGDLYLNGTTVGSEGNDLLFRTYVKTAGCIR